jgi:poly(hydroxyalkanoate) granule-associated protein
MLKKAKAAMETEKESAKAGTGGGGPAAGSGDLAKKILDSSHHIWLAGLGAFARAQAEGTKVFETLVKQGEHLEKKTRQAASDTAAAARVAAKSKAKEMQDMAGGTWDKLEQVFEDRVARALSKLGFHTQNDVQRLAARVDELSSAVNDLLKANGGSRKAGAGLRAKPPKKPSAKAAAAKRARKTPPAAKPART